VHTQQTDPAPRNFQDPVDALTNGLSQRIRDQDDQLVSAPQPSRTIRHQQSRVGEALGVQPEATELNFGIIRHRTRRSDPEQEDPIGSEDRMDGGAERLGGDLPLQGLKRLPVQHHGRRQHTAGIS
jgi:hypothetical protein